MQDVSSALNRIMSAAEYVAHASHARPYEYELRSGTHILNYFGTSHVHRVGDPVLEKIKDIYEQVQPDCVIVEGLMGAPDTYERIIPKLSHDELINEMGEAGYLVSMALRDGRSWQSPEPNEKDLFEYLQQKGYSRGDIFAYKFINVLAQYEEKENKEGFEKYFQIFLDNFIADSSWAGYDYSFENGKRLACAMVGYEIDTENTNNIIEYVDPTPWPDKLASQKLSNRIGEATSRFRDLSVVSALAIAVEEYNKVLVVYGSSHAVMQEPALRALFV